MENRFRKLGFAKWGKDILPVMFLSPYDIPPGYMREQWMQMFANVSNMYTLLMIKHAKPVFKLNTIPNTQLVD